MIQIDSRRSKGGHEPGEQTRHDGECTREREHTEIERHSHPARHVPASRREGDQTVHRPTRDQQAQSATRQEQQHALDEHLLNQPASARPECRADQALSRARHAARQQKVRHVCAGNQKTSPTALSINRRP